MKIKMILVFAIIMVLAVLLCGCTITSGVFMGMSYNSSDTSLTANYKSFDGSITKRLSLKADDEVSFAFQGDSGFNTTVKQSGEELAVITDGSEFTVPADGTYDFTVEGKATDGAFSLSWSIE